MQSIVERELIEIGHEWLLAGADVRSTMPAAFSWTDTNEIIQYLKLSRERAFAKHECLPPQ